MLTCNLLVSLCSQVDSLEFSMHTIRFDNRSHAIRVFELEDANPELHDVCSPGNESCVCSNSALVRRCVCVLQFEILYRLESALSGRGGHPLQVHYVYYMYAERPWRQNFTLKS